MVARLDIEIAGTGCQQELEECIGDAVGKLESGHRRDNFTFVEWLAASTYYNAGYKRDRSKQYGMAWPTPESPGLQGKPIARSVEL